MQLEYNREKLEYLRKYDPMNDYIQSTLIKQNKATTDQDFKLDPSDLDLKKLTNQLGQVKNTVDLENTIVVNERVKQMIVAGFNCCIYGYGSKYDLINEIIEEVMLESPSITIFQMKGFKPQANIKSLLQHMVDTLKQKKKDVPKREDNMIEWISENVQKRILLVIHSIDGKHLCNKQTQQLIGTLSNHSYISILCSFDNYRYPQICRLTNPMYVNFNTLIPYVNEIQQQFEDLTGKQKQEEGLWFVLASMTKRQNEIMWYLADTIITTKDGLTFSQLFEICCNEMVVANTEQLRENIKELMEHNILELKKDKYQIPFSQGVLKQLASKIQQ